MSDLFWRTEEQMQRIELYSPLSHSVPLVDERQIVSGIIFVIRSGLRWRLHQRLTVRPGRSNAMHLKAHRTAASLLKRGLISDVSDVRGAA